jgi:cytochrome c-type biogenesis protein CcmH/NrfF
LLPRKQTTTVGFWFFCLIILLMGKVVI